MSNIKYDPCNHCRDMEYACDCGECSMYNQIVEAETERNEAQARARSLEEVLRVKQDQIKKLELQIMSSTLAKGLDFERAAEAGRNLRDTVRLTDTKDRVEQLEIRIGGLERRLARVESIDWLLGKFR